jgi:hypothetical protein
VQQAPYRGVRPGLAAVDEEPHAPVWLRNPALFAAALLRLERRYDALLPALCRQLEQARAAQRLGRAWGWTGLEVLAQRVTSAQVDVRAVTVAREELRRWRVELLATAAASRRGCAGPRRTSPADFRASVEPSGAAGRVPDTAECPARAPL